MDNNTRIIAQAKVNTDVTTGLDRYSQVTALNIDGSDNGRITVYGRIVLLAPTGVCMEIESQWSFVRYDRPATFADVLVVDAEATYYVAGEDMGGGVLAIGGELKTAEVSHYVSQQVKPANNKYTALEESAIGLGIKQMLGLDLSGAISGGLWVEESLKQL